jgi:asparagine synthase (glutamine-hydrolysing)
LRRQLEKGGHAFRTGSDVEVLPHLYEEYGTDFLNLLNGQFAFALYDRRLRRLLMARDHFGICPLHYAVFGDTLVFASEIKGIMAHPAAVREVDLTGLDQVFTFPGLVSPVTMFKRVRSLPSGHYALAEGSGLEVREYWDIVYPREGEADYTHPESYYVERLDELFTASVRRRLQADVPVGFYLSGGLDSSLIAATVRDLSPDARRHSFSVTFTDRGMSEDDYQEMVVRRTGSEHHRIHFEWRDLMGRLPRMIRHSECPVKETYNTCSMALSEEARAAGVPVILTGEGADELFAGYIGYRFDNFERAGAQAFDPETFLEDQLREQLWGTRELLYETDHHAFRAVRAALYSEGVNEIFPDFDCLNLPLVNKERLRGRHPLHQRSYLDFKLRLSDHLVSDHGDRMALANSVEARYPFLDVELVEFAAQVPLHLKLNGFQEKYILKRVAEGKVPEPIIRREKFGFHAPGSPYLLHLGGEWINDLLAPDRVRRQGYFNPAAVETLKGEYLREDFKLSLPYESDLLFVILSFTIFLEEFGLPDFT